MFVVSYTDDDLNPQSWRLDIEQRSIDLYLSLHDAPRALRAEECDQLVEMIDAWRAGDHRKHIVLMGAHAAVDPAIALEIAQDDVEDYGSRGDH